MKFFFLLFPLCAASQNAASQNQNVPDATIIVEESRPPAWVVSVPRPGARPRELWEAQEEWTKELPSNLQELLGGKTLLEALMGREGNGGDPVAIEFQAVGLQVIADVRQYSELFPELTGVDLESILRLTPVFVVDTPPLVSLSILPNQVQGSAVTNFRDPNLYVIFREGWEAQTDPKLRKAMVFHELASLGRLESTGVYSLTLTYQKLLAGTGGLDAYLAGARGRSVREIAPGISEAQVNELIQKENLCAHPSRQWQFLEAPSTGAEVEARIANYVVRTCVRRAPAASCTTALQEIVFAVLAGDQTSALGKEAAAAVRTTCFQYRDDLALGALRGLVDNLGAAHGRLRQ